MSIRIDGTNTTANPGITGSDTDTGLQFGTDEVSIVTGGTTRATVDSSGRLGIGTESPASLLHLNTDGTALRVSRGSSIGFLYNTGTSSTDATRLQGNSGPVEIFTNAAQPIKVVVNGTEEARFLSGGGITFNGDTAQANALDDYEEGTFTPTPQFGGGSTGMTYNTAPTGHYTKIGNLVFVQLGFHFSNKGTSTGSFTIGGLPYSVANTGSFRHPNSVVNAHNMQSTGMIFGALGTGTNLNYRKLNESQSDTVPGHGDFTNNTGFYHSMVYTT